MMAHIRPLALPTSWSADVPDGITEIFETALAKEPRDRYTSSAEMVEKLLFLGSSCIYPKFADQPLTEDALLTGELEPTNQWYAVAKIAGIKLCQA